MVRDIEHVAAQPERRRSIQRLEPEVSIQTQVERESSRKASEVRFGRHVTVRVNKRVREACVNIHGGRDYQRGGQIDSTPKQESIRRIQPRLSIAVAGNERLFKHSNRRSEQIQIANRR